MARPPAAYRTCASLACDTPYLVVSGMDALCILSGGTWILDDTILNITHYNTITYRKHLSSKSSSVF